MPTHMGVQSFATARNAKVEIFIDFILGEFCKKLQEVGRVGSFVIQSQKHYESAISSDIWDHYVELNDKAFMSKVILWCQTTCYKGNKTGKPEPNKTYEVRETLVEAISIREHFKKECGSYLRSVHFTVGSKKYTYDWFEGAKNSAFDLSLYVDDSEEDIFEMIADAQGNCSLEFQIKNNLGKLLLTESKITTVVSSAVERLYNYYTDEGLRKQSLADEQWKVVQSRIELYGEVFKNCLVKSKSAGQDIKKVCNEVVHGLEPPNEIIEETVDLLLSKNPFIKTAKECLDDWDRFVKNVKALFDPNLRKFVINAWSTDKRLRLILRRLLLRVHSESSINYIQDLNISGVTEHNLYKGNHDEDQTSGIIDHVIKNYTESDVTTSNSLMSLLTGKTAKQILRSSVWFEARNGTSLKPSFDYIVNCLKRKGYKIVPASKLTQKPIGYHAQLVEGQAQVKSYTNLKAIVDKNGSPVAILKGKYFRQQEFPRRCKEEAYVALSLKYIFEKEKLFLGRSYPIIMYVDMPKDFDPPEYALNRLQAFGWEVAFNENDIIEILTR